MLLVVAVGATGGGGTVGAGIAVAIAGGAAVVAVDALVAAAITGDGATTATVATVAAAMVGDVVASAVGVVGAIDAVAGGFVAAVVAVGGIAVAVDVGSAPQAASRALLAASAEPPSAIRSNPLRPPGSRGLSSGTLNKPCMSRIVGRSLHEWVTHTLDGGMMPTCGQIRKRTAPHTRPPCVNMQRGWFVNHPRNDHLRCEQRITGTKRLAGRTVRRSARPRAAGNRAYRSRSPARPRSRRCGLPCAHC